MKFSDNIIIVHGFLARPENHWFPWLKKVSEEKGFQVIITDIPNVDTYIKDLEKIKGKINNKTWLIAHSIGCSAVMELLSSVNDCNLPKGIIMISGFIDPLPVWESDDSLNVLNKYIGKNINFNKIKNIEHRYVISSNNDYYVPPELSFKLSKAIDSYYINLCNYGHFTESDDVYEIKIIPLILDNKLI